MSKQRRNGKYVVRWREGGRQRARTFDRSGDADAFEAEIRRRRQLGAIAGTVLETRMTLAEFVATDWWPRHAIPNLSEDTRRRYLEVWGTHLLDRLGGYRITDITPELVEDLLQQLAANGVGVPTQRKALMMLQGILRRAYNRRLISANPVQMVQKPKTPPPAARRPLAPATVELIREYMLTRTWSSAKRGSGRSPAELARYRQRNAMIVSLMAYAGLRPVEDRNLTWGAVQAKTLFVVATKTNTARHVELLAPLAQDLAEWRLISGRPDDTKLIAPRLDGGEWTRDDWNNWRRRVWLPAAKACGVTGDMRPYRLRHGFVSLLLWEGRSLAYVADQSGHSIATLAKHYAGVIAELEDTERIPAAEAIRRARAGESSPLRAVARAGSA